MKIGLKLITYTLAVVMAVGTLLSVFSIHQGRRFVLSSYEKECRKIVDLLSRNIANDVYFLDAISLDRQLQNTRINPDISFLVVIDMEGEVLSEGALGNRLRNRKLVDPFSQKMMKASNWIVEVNQNLLKIGGPVKMPDGATAGYLQAGFNMSRAYAIVRQMTLLGVYLSAVCFALGAVLAFFLSRNFTRPIRLLVQATQAVREKKFDTRVFLRRRDELGQLADSFNQMAEDLGETIAERERAEGRLLQSLQEKEVLLKEIHHRVKNNLQIVTSLLRLQAGHVQDPQALEILRESQNRIRSIASVHEQLYLSEDFSNVDFSQYIQNLLHHLFRSYGVDPGRISLKTNLQQISLEMDYAIPCSIILHELITNVVKHAFPGGRSGRIEIDLKEGADHYELVCRDDGVGLPPGLEMGSASSLGLQLVAALVDQIQGRLECRREGGTEFRIRFPKRKRAGEAPPQST